MEELSVVHDQGPADYYWCRYRPTRVCDFHFMIGQRAWAIHAPSLLRAALSESQP